jgi:hypothetical protein
MKMKKIIITSLTLSLIVMVATTLSNKSPSEQAAEDHAIAQRKTLKEDSWLDAGLRQRMQEKAAERQPTERTKVEERLAKQREEFEQNLYHQPIEILTNMNYANQQNLQRIQVLEGKVKLLEERLKKLETTEKNLLYQQRKLEEQLESALKRLY